MVGSKLGLTATGGGNGVKPGPPVGGVRIGPGRGWGGFSGFGPSTVRSG